MTSTEWRAQLERLIFEAGDRFRFDVFALRTWPETLWAWLRGRP